MQEEESLLNISVRTRKYNMESSDDSLLYYYDNKIEDDVKLGLKIEIGETCEYHSDSKLVFLEVISLPSINRILVFRASKIYIFNTLTMEKIQEIIIPGIYIRYMEQLNSEIVLLTTIDEKIVQFHRIGNILDGKLEMLNSIHIEDLDRRILVRVNEDKFVTIPWENGEIFELTLSEEEEEEEDIADNHEIDMNSYLFSYSEMKIVDSFSFENTTICIEEDNIIKPSPKFIGRLYIAVGGLFTSAETNHISLFNLDTKIVEKSVELEDNLELDDVKELSFFHRDNEEFIIVTGSYNLEFGNSLAIIFNFSKKIPIVVHKIGHNDENYKNLVGKEIGSCNVLCNQVLFLCEKISGSLVSTDLTNNYEKFFNLKVSKEVIRNIQILSFSKNNIKIAVIGKKKINVVGISGIELDCSKSRMEKIIQEDEKERIEFLWNFQDLYLFNSDIMEKKSFLEVKLSNKIIKNVFKSLY